MAKKVSISCINVFKSKDEVERKILYSNCWVKIINNCEKTKTVISKI